MFEHPTRLPYPRDLSALESIIVTLAMALGTVVTVWWLVS